MRRRDGAKRKFNCADGEEITVTVTSQGTVHNVAYAKDEQDWDGSPFTVHATGNPDDVVSSIVIFVIFSNPSGGQYTIKVVGNPDEDMHEETLPQDTTEGSLTEDSKGYKFFCPNS